MLNKSLSFLILVVLSSCAISINENNFKYLSPSDRTHFKKFISADLTESPSTKPDYDSLSIYEVCNQDIKTLVRRNKFTLVHIWAPYCKGEGSKSILPNSLNMKEKYHSNGFDVLLISNSYSFDDIKKAVMGSKYNLPVYVLCDSCYGSKQGRAMKQFASDMDNNQILKKSEYFSSYFFKDTLLVKASWNITMKEIDSIIGPIGGQD